MQTKKLNKNSISITYDYLDKSESKKIHYLTSQEALDEHLIGHGKRVEYYTLEAVTDDNKIVKIIIGENSISASID